MNDNRLDRITLCDYEMCPTVNNEVYAMIVVKLDGNSHSIETGTSNSNSHGYYTVEDRAI